MQQSSLSQFILEIYLKQILNRNRCPFRSQSLPWIIYWSLTWMFHFKTYNKLHQNSSSDFEGAPVSARVVLWCWRERWNSRVGRKLSRVLHCKVSPFSLWEQDKRKRQLRVFVSLAWKQGDQERWFTRLSWHWTGNKPDVLETCWPGGARSQCTISHYTNGAWMKTGKNFYNQITEEEGANTKWALTFEDRYNALLCLINVLPSSSIEERAILVSRHKT